MTPTDTKGHAIKLAAFRKLNLEYSKLPSMHADWKLSRSFVAGKGPANAALMIIGQAPGANEDVQKLPFVGRSGKLLTETLAACHIDREKAYITSVVQFFPPKNRMPSRKEIEMCKPFLFRQIEIIKPRFVILLGSVASSAVLGRGKVRKEHGRIMKKGGTTYLIAFHPAAALRSTNVKRMFAEDIERFGELSGF